MKPDPEPNSDATEGCAAMPFSVALWPLAGRAYIVKVNGNRSLNGALYGTTSFGTIEAAEDGKTAWDVLRAIVDKMEEEHATMEHVQCVQITLRPPNAVAQTREKGQAND